MRLDQLAQGARFRLPLSGREGTVLYVGLTGVRVEYTDHKQRRAFATESAKLVEFETSRRVTIAGSAAVELLP